jgi:ABC-type phosphate transport system substrate-binding protein
MRARARPVVEAIMSVLLWACPWGAAVGVTVIANPQTPVLNEDMLQKVYLGKVIEVNGRPVIPVNLREGNATRKAFMEQVMSQQDDKYIAYWTVRRYIGKGSPPREFDTVEQQLEFVRTTPGAIGYVDESVDLKQGVRTLLTRP